MMRKVVLSTLVLILILSCENEIIVIDEIESKPVIYSFLNLNDTAYSVSLTRTFIEEEDILNLTNNPDLVFYDSANIQLEGIGNDSIIWSTNFYKSEEVKNEGIFPENPGYLYLSNSVISEFDNNGFLTGPFRNINRFILSVEIPSSNISASSSVSVFHPNFILQPSSGREISLYGYEEFNIVVSTLSNSAYRQINFRIHYWEKLKELQELQEIEIEFIARKDLQVYDNKIIVKIPPDFFFNKLAANIPIIEDLQYRKFIDFDILLYSSDDVFANYRDTYQYTTDLQKPAWSNIENGIGIFSLLFMQTKEGFTINQRSRDSLALSPITRNLKFVRWE